MITLEARSEVAAHDDRSDAPSPEAGGGTGARPTDARDVDEAIDTLGGDTDVTAG